MKKKRILDWVKFKPLIQKLAGELDVDVTARMASGEFPPWLVAEFYNQMLKDMFKNALPETYPYHVISFLKLFWYQGELVYKIAREFGDVLFRADCKVSIDYIPFDNIVRCIEFPDDKLFDMKNGDYAQTAYIAAFKSQDKIWLSPEGQNFNKRIDIIVPLHNENQPDGQMGHDQIKLLFLDDETLEQAIERSIKNTTSPTGFSRDLVEFLLKCILYIHSGDPDLREYKPMRRPHSPKKQRQWLRENLSPIPITLVGFEYKKPRVMNAEEAFVETHLRWQPFGPNRSKVKLIWVKEHIRRYSKEES